MKRANTEGLLQIELTQRNTLPVELANNALGPQELVGETSLRLVPAIAELPSPTETMELPQQSHHTIADSDKRPSYHAQEQIMQRDEAKSKS